MPRHALLVVIAVQAVLCARLIEANTAFQDEALYLWAGRLEIAHWLTGVAIPPYPVYFSGAPVVYPPLGALAASIGGLAGARLLSMAFMLGATVLLHGVTRRIFDRRSALFAAALFAGTGSAQFLGAFATYDAMALFLLAAATWLGVRAMDSRPAARIGLLAAAGLVLAVADAAKYASALYDPVVALVIVLFAWDRRGRGGGLAAGAVTTVVTCGVLAAAIEAAGPAYWHGVTYTTLARPAGPSAPSGIVFDGVGWIVALVILALVGAAVVAYVGRSHAEKALAVVLAGALFLATANQARIHTFTSLFKHVGYGAWFGAAVAGFAVASLAHAVPAANVRRAAHLGVAAVAAAGLLGAAISANQFGNWPDARPVNAILTGLAHPGSQYLVEDADVQGYYFDDKTRWEQWASTWSFRYADRRGRVLTGLAAYAAAIRAGYFNVIVLAFADTVRADQAIQRDIVTAGNYRLVRIVPYATTSASGDYRIWVRTPRRSLWL